VASIDVNGDGQVDLFICRDSGVYLYLNDKGKFTGKKLDLPFDKKSTAISLALGDIDRDGHVDLYAACYLPKDQMEGQNIFNKAGYGANSLLLRNNGDNTFSDVTAKAGLAYTHNTFQGVFVDLDDDGAVDLVVAHDTGEVRTYRNKGDGTFEMKPNPTTGIFSYPMGIGVGDYNNDGRIDLVFSNVGDTVPSFIARGDLRADQTFSGKTFLFRNDGNFQFTEAGPETLTADYEFGWGLVFKDFNLDGLQDIALAQNYIGFPPHKFFRLPCRLLIQNADHTFAAVEAAAGVENRLYAISPVVADFNQDGYPDLVYANLDGPCRAFLNQGGKNHHVKVALKDVPASLGAVVTVQLANGRKLTAPFIASEGLLSDQAHVLTFGLGQETAIAEIKVKFPSGKEATLAKPAADKTHLIEPQ